MERTDDRLTPTSASAADSAAGGADPESSVPEIKAEIEQTRVEMQQTIAEIQDRLSPSRLAEQAKSSVREATIGRVSNMAQRAGRTASEVATHTRTNPLPFILIGAGVAWLIAGSRSQRDRWNDDWHDGDETIDDEYGSRSFDDDYESGRSGMRQVRAKVSDMASNVGDMASNVGEMASNVGRKARDLGRATQSRVSQTMDDNPLTLGVVALAAGAVIGMMLPRTEVEDSYLGETRDSVLESAREMAQDKVQQLSDATRDSGAGAANPS
jgi:uncharacterized protein DUF3618